MSRAYLSAVDHDAKLDSPVRVGTSSKSFGSAKLVAESVLWGTSKERHLAAWLADEGVRRMERYLVLRGMCPRERYLLLWCVEGETLVWDENRIREALS